MATGAERVIAVRFIVDKAELSKEMDKLNKEAARLDAQFDSLASGTGKLTTQQRALFNSYVRTQKSTGDLSREAFEYWKIQKDLRAQLAAGIITQEQYNRELDRQRAILAKVNLQSSRRAADIAARRLAQQAQSQAKETSTLIKMTDALSASNRGLIGTINDLSFKFFVLTFTAKQMGETLLRAFVQVGEDVQKLRFRFEQLTGDAKVFDELYDSAQRLGVGVEDMAGAFTRFAIANKTLGLTNQELVQMTENISVLGLLGGGNLQETTSAMIQLGQAMASGRLAGDELRSVMENMPLLAVRLAEKLDRTTGQLREMGAAGELTGKVVSGAILEMTEELQHLVEQIPETSDRALARMSNSWMNLIDSLVSTTGTQGVTGAISGMAESFDKLAEYIDANAAEVRILISVLGEMAKVMAMVFVGTKFLQGLAGMIGGIAKLRAEVALATGAFAKLRAAAVSSMGALGPIALAISAVTTALFAWKAAQEDAKRAAEDLANAAALQADELERLTYNQREAMRLDYEQARSMMIKELVAAEAELVRIEKDLDDVRQRGRGTRANRQRQIENATNAQIRQAAAVDDLKATIQALEAELRKITGAQDAAAGSAQELASTYASLGSAANTAMSQLQRVAYGNLSAEDQLVADFQKNMQQVATLRADAAHDAEEAARFELEVVKDYWRRRKELEERNAPRPTRARGGGGGTSAAERARREEVREQQRAQDEMLRVIESQLSESERAYADYYKALETLRIANFDNEEMYADARFAIEERLQKQLAAVVEETAKEISDVEQAIAQDLEAATEQFFSSLLTGSASAEDAFKTLLSTIQQMIVKMLILEPLMESLKSSFGSSSGGLWGALASMFGGSTRAANGAVISGGVAPGVYTSPSWAPAAVSGTQAMANGGVLFAEAGPEAVLPLSRGPGGKLGVSGGGTVVNLIDQRGAKAPPIEMEQTTGPTGDQQIRILVREEVKNAISSGHMDRTMQGTYGASRRPVRR